MSSSLVPLALPVALPLAEVAGFRATRESLAERAGPPHHVERDTRRTAGGEEEAWAWTAATGQRLLLVLRVSYEDASIYADPPLGQPAVDALAAIIDGAEVTIYSPAWPVR